jgi:hypothetical protein
VVGAGGIVVITVILGVDGAVSVVDIARPLHRPVSAKYITVRRHRHRVIRGTSGRRVDRSI